jgi:hypothetical protein
MPRMDRSVLTGRCTVSAGGASNQGGIGLGALPLQARCPLADHLLEVIDEVLLLTL